MLDSQRACCPYCGEPIELLIDPSAGEQSYIEDCQVCCRPIEISLRIDSDGDFQIHVGTDND